MGFLKFFLCYFRINQGGVRQVALMMSLLFRGRLNYFYEVLQSCGYFIDFFLENAQQNIENKTIDISHF